MLKTSKKGKKMAIQTYINGSKNSLQKGKERVGWCAKIKTLNLYRATKIMVENQFGPFNFVLLKFDPDKKETFWISPCTEDELGAKRVFEKNKTKLIRLSKGFLDNIGLKEIERGAFGVAWDKRNQGLKIDLTNKYDVSQIKDVPEEIEPPKKQRLPRRKRISESLEQTV